jgi:Cft2 family RNA processing exonuclease
LLIGYMKLIDLNRDGEIGANCQFVQIGDLNLVVDCGLNPKKAGRIAAPDFSLLRGLRVDLIIITHCHLDHIGSLPILMREQPDAVVIMTQSSHMLIERMLHNSASVMVRQRDDQGIKDYPLFTHDEIDRLAKRLTPVPYNVVKRFKPKKDEISLVFHPAGHVAGAAGVEIHHKARHIFFTGDVLFENQRTLPGAKFPAGHFDTLIMETTRGMTERPADKTRVAEVARLIETINHTIKAGGSFLIPVFALGRQQEIMAILSDARKFGKLVECPIYASGLGMDLVDYFDEIGRKTKHVNFSKSVLKDLKVQKTPRELKAGVDPKKNAIFIISSGMMVERTPSYTLASGLLGGANNTIGFVGYCDPDTPGGALLGAKSGDTFLFEAVNVKTKIRARVEKFELSGHADREELLEFAVQASPRSIVLTHGESPARAWFKEQLHAKLPKSNIIDPKPLQPYTI